RGGHRRDAGRRRNRRGTGGLIWSHVLRGGRCLAWRTGPRALSKEDGVAIVARNLIARPRWVEALEESGWWITGRASYNPADPLPSVSYDNDPDPTHDGAGYRPYGT